MISYYGKQGTDGKKNNSEMVCKITCKNISEQVIHYDFKFVYMQITNNAILFPYIK